MKKFVVIASFFVLASLLCGYVYHAYQTELALVYHVVKIVKEDPETREILKRDSERHGLKKFKQLLIWLYDRGKGETKAANTAGTPINSEPAFPLPLQPINRGLKLPVPIEAVAAVPSADNQVAKAPNLGKTAVNKPAKSEPAQTEAIESPAPKQNIGPRRKAPLKGEIARMEQDRTGIPSNESIKYAGEYEEEEFRATWGSARWGYAFYRRKKSEKYWKEFKPIHASHGRPDNPVCTIVLPETPLKEFRGGTKSPHIVLRRVGSYERD